MSIDWWTVALQIVNFLVLVWLLKRFLYAPALRVIENRRRREEEALAAARRMQEEAEARQRELEERLVALAREREQMRQKLREENERERERVLAEARAEARRFLEEAERRLRHEREETLRALRAELAGLAVTMADRLLAPLRGPALDEAFFRRLLGHLGGLPEERRAELREALAADAGRVELASASPPDGPRTTIFREELARILPDGTALRLVTAPELGAGVELRMPHLRMEFSLRRALAEAREELARAAATA